MLTKAVTLAVGNQSFATYAVGVGEPPPSNVVGETAVVLYDGQNRCWYYVPTIRFSNTQAGRVLCDGEVAYSIPNNGGFVLNCCTMSPQFKLTYYTAFCCCGPYSRCCHSCYYGMKLETVVSSISGNVAICHSCPYDICFYDYCCSSYTRIGRMCNGVTSLSLSSVETCYTNNDSILIDACNALIVMRLNGYYTSGATTICCYISPKSWGCQYAINRSNILGR